MALNMNIDGMEIYLNIKGYQKTNSENWDDTWCNVDAESRNDDCKYATLATQEDFDRF